MGNLNTAVDGKIDVTMMIVLIENVATGAVEWTIERHERGESESDADNGDHFAVVVDGDSTGVLGVGASCGADQVDRGKTDVVNSATLAGKMRRHPHRAPEPEGRTLFCTDSGPWIEQQRSVGLSKRCCVFVHHHHESPAHDSIRGRCCHHCGEKDGGREGEQTERLAMNDGVDDDDLRHRFGGRRCYCCCSTCKLRGLPS
jgi:hypothetical protein